MKKGKITLAQAAEKFDTLKSKQTSSIKGGIGPVPVVIVITVPIGD